VVYGAQRSLVVFRLFKIELANSFFPSESIPQILQLEEIWDRGRTSQNSVSTSVDFGVDFYVLMKVEIRIKF
jgi:hypothetical protein